MTRRSQATSRARYGVDSSGWNGSVLSISNPLPITGAPGGGSVAANLSGPDGPLVGVTLLGTTEDAAVATIDASEVTDSNGNASFTYSRVATGKTNLNITYVGAPHVTHLAVVVT